MSSVLSPFIWFGRKAVDPNDIVRLEADRNYTLFFFLDGSKTLMSHTLAFYEGTLPPHFIRVHKSHYVNTEYVKNLGNGPRSELELNNGKRIPIARRRWKVLKDFARTL